VMVMMMVVVNGPQHPDAARPDIAVRSIPSSVVAMMMVVMMVQIILHRDYIRRHDTALCVCKL